MSMAILLAGNPVGFRLTRTLLLIVSLRNAKSISLG